MLGADVCEGALEELFELLVGRLEVRIREVDLGHELHHSASTKHRALHLPSNTVRGPAC